MAETIISVCPECQARVKVPIDAVGKRLRCKKCETTYRIEAESAPASLPPSKPKPAAKPPAKPAAAPIPVARDDDDDELENDKPYQMIHDDSALPLCPFCAQQLASMDAKICANCGYDVVARSRVKSKAVYEHTGMEVTMWLLPGVACLIGVIVLITLDVIAIVKMSQWLEGSFLQNEDKTWLIKPGAFSVYTTVFSMAFILPMGKFAYKRLAIVNKPPEVSIKRE